MHEQEKRELITGAVASAAAAEVVVSRLAQIGAASGGVCIVVQFVRKETGAPEREPRLALTANVSAAQAEAARAAFDGDKIGEENGNGEGGI